MKFKESDRIVHRYYPDTDSLYIELSDKASVDSQEITDGVVVDIDEQGNAVGIDIDNASKRSALDVDSVNLGVSTEEIVAIIREVRERAG